MFARAASWPIVKTSPFKRTSRSRIKSFRACEIVTMEQSCATESASGTGAPKTALTCNEEALSLRSGEYSRVPADAGLAPPADAGLAECAAARNARVATLAGVPPRLFASLCGVPLRLPLRLPWRLPWRLLLGVRRGDDDAARPRGVMGKRMRRYPSTRENSFTSTRNFSRDAPTVGSAAVNAAIAVAAAPGDTRGEIASGVGGAVTRNVPKTAGSATSRAPNELGAAAEVSDDASIVALRSRPTPPWLKAPTRAPSLSSETAPLAGRSSSGVPTNEAERSRLRKFDILRYWEHRCAVTSHALRESTRTCVASPVSTATASPG